MSLLSHILERGGLHIVASSFVTLALYFFARWMKRRYEEWYVLGTIVLGVLMGAAIREVYDVSVGEPLIKAITDMISWTAGAALTAWAIKRIQDGGGCPHEESL